MAGAQKAPEAEGATKDIINYRGGKLTTSRGTIGQGQSIRLPAAEADKCLKYRGIKDMAQVAPEQAKESDALKKENADLKEQLRAQQEKIDASGKGGEGELAEGSEVLMTDDTPGTIKSIKGKVATITMEDGGEAKAKLSELRPKPQA